MKQYPNIWTLAELLRAADGGESAGINCVYYPARPLGFCSIGQRIKAARLVFSGKADAVTWPGGQ